MLTRSAIGAFVAVLALSATAQARGPREKDRDDEADEEAPPKGPFASAEETRAAWARRGGALAAYSIEGQITGLLLRVNNPNLVQLGTKTQTFTERNNAGGGGGGIRLATALLVLAPPSPGLTTTTFAGRLGAGVDFSANTFSYPTPATPGHGSETKTTSDFVFVLAGTAGVQLGSGSFVGDDKWRGIVVGVDYRPSYVYTLPGVGKTTGAVNYLGVQVTIDVKTLEATMGSIAPKAGVRGSVFVLPPVGDLPLLVSIGFGAIWY